MQVEVEVGDRLYWFDVIDVSGGEDLPNDAPERYATVTAVENGYVHFEFDDGLVDWFPEDNLGDYFERVTWDHKTS